MTNDKSNNNYDDEDVIFIPRGRRADDSVCCWQAIRPAVYESIVTRNNDIRLPPANAYVDPYPSGREHEAVIAPEGTQATQKTGLRGFNY
jgi:hypothetical protein